MSKIFQLDSSLPFAAHINPEIIEAQSVCNQKDANRGNHVNSLQSSREGMADAYKGDSLAASDFVLPGTTLRWVQTTEVQGKIYEFYQEAGREFPPDFEALLHTNSGPAFMPDGSNSWNASYQEMGLVPGNPGTIPVVEALNVDTNEIVKVLNLAA